VPQLVLEARARVEKHGAAGQKQQGRVLEGDLAAGLGELHGAGRGRGGLGQGQAVGPHGVDAKGEGCGQGQQAQGLAEDFWNKAHLGLRCWSGQCWSGRRWHD
jgi:hypothetical protein